MNRNIKNWFNQLDNIGKRTVIKDTRISALKYAKRFNGTVTRFDILVELRKKYFIGTKYKVEY